MTSLRRDSTRVQNGWMDATDRPTDRPSVRPFRAVVPLPSGASLIYARRYLCQRIYIPIFIIRNIIARAFIALVEKPRTRATGSLSSLRAPRPPPLSRSSRRLSGSVCPRPGSRGACGRVTARCDLSERVASIEGPHPCICGHALVPGKVAAEHQQSLPCDFFDCRDRYNRLSFVIYSANGNILWFLIVTFTILAILHFEHT